MSKFWLVEVAEDLEHLPVTSRTSPTTRRGVWESILDVNGVVRLTDLDAIGRETLDQFLRPPDPVVEQLTRRRRR